MYEVHSSTTPDLTRQTMSCARELSIGRSRKELGGIRRENVFSSLSHLMGLLGWLSLDKESGQAPKVVGWVWQAWKSRLVYGSMEYGTMLRTKKRQ